MPKRFGIRSLLAVMTLFGVFFAWRFSGRYRIVRASETVLERGGRVLHTWQDPTVGMITIQPQPAMVPVAINGGTELRTRTLALPPVAVQTVFHDERKPRPPFSIASTFLGNNRDVDIGLVVIPCDQVDKDLIDSLRTIKTLKNVMCVPVDNSYSRAMNMLKDGLPNVEVSSGRRSDLSTR